MAGGASDQENPPRIALAQIGIKRDQAPERWRIAWLVENRGSDSLKIESARLPHGQFKSGEVRFDPALLLPPGKSAEFTVSVCCHEPPGLVTENAFMIFYAVWLGEPCRIFARLRVNVSDAGQPAAVTESITAQRVGFSGAAW